MSQNKSHAVMQQRSETRDSLDDFPTPPWAARALCEYVINVDRSDVILEPACNRGYLIKGLEDYSDNIIGTDIMDYGYFGHMATMDFTKEQIINNPDWVITNPPFNKAEEFIDVSMKIANKGCAFILRTSFLESKGRYDRIYNVNPPSKVAQFVERVPMLKGRYDPKGTTATSYMWFVWEKQHTCSTEMVWIPPCRLSLQKPTDVEIEK